MGKKDLLANLLYAGGFLSILRRLRKMDHREIRILAYHRIYDLDVGHDYLFDRELISANTAEFEWQIQHVHSHYNPITFAELIGAIDGKKRLPPRPVLITFDDGYEDNYTNAFPILKKCGVPAMIFLATDYIGSVKPFWFDLVVYLLNTSDEADLTDIPGVGPDSENQSREDIARKVLRYLKAVPNARRLEMLELLEEHHAGGYPKNGFVESRPMSWEQVEEMSAAGIEFGSHTCTHPILSKLDNETLEREVTVSKRKIESITGKRCDVIAYPVGGRNEYDDRTKKVVEQTGYRLGMTYETGTNYLEDQHVLEMKRLHVESYVSRARFAAMLSLPTVFG